MHLTVKGYIDCSSASLAIVMLLQQFEICHNYCSVNNQTNRESILKCSIFNLLFLQMQGKMYYYALLLKLVNKNSEKWWLNFSSLSYKKLTFVMSLKVLALALTSVSLALILALNN